MVYAKQLNFIIVSVWCLQSAMHFQKVLIVGAIIIGFLAILWMIICALLNEKLPNSLPLKDGYTFDYIVVGAGTAGCVLTSMLTKHSNGTVLLIEAGGTFGILSKIPLLTTFQQQGLNDWAFLSVPQRHSAKGLDKLRQSLPRGKGLGGSAQLNYMLHFAGYAPDFDRWHEEFNLSEWRAEDVQPFLNAASPNAHERFDLPSSYSKLTEALFEAEAEFSHKSWNFRRSSYNVKNGLRNSVWHRFLQPMLNNWNLRTLTNALVKKIILSKDANKVEYIIVGIKDEYTRKEQLFRINVNRELLLSAGAFQSPQLLFASGIGDSQELKNLKIPLQMHLPRVGLGLHDHFNIPLFVTIDVVGPTLNDRTLFAPSTWLSYITTGSGPLANFGVLGHVIDYKKPSFALTIFGAGAIDESALMSISNFKRPAFRALFPRHHNTSQEGFVLISSCLQPKSRGSVSVAGESMRKNPRVDPNYLSESEDIKCTIAAMRHAVELVTSTSLASLHARIQWPKLKECAEFGPSEHDFKHNTPSDHYLECIMRHLGLSSHHPGGSCSMGTNANNSVVDEQLKVHGLQNLRIVDASVLPTPISGNPNTVIAAIALRAAAWILKDELKENSN